MQDPYAGLDLLAPIQEPDYGRDPDSGRERRRKELAEQQRRAGLMPQTVQEGPYAGLELLPAPEMSFMERAGSVAREFAAGAAQIGGAAPAGTAARLVQGLAMGAPPAPYTGTRLEQRELLKQAAYQDALAEGLPPEEAEKAAKWFASRDDLTDEQRDNIARQQYERNVAVHYGQELPDWAKGPVEFLNALELEAREALPQGDPRTQGNIPEVLANAFGSTIGFGVSGFLGRAAGLGSASRLASVSGAMLEGTAAWHEAESIVRPLVESGEITPEEAEERKWAALVEGAYGGSLEGLPIGQWLARFDKRVGGGLTKAWMRNIGLDALYGAAEEAPQETLQQIINNWSMIRAGDEDRRLFDMAVVQGGAIGGVVGLAMSAAMSALGLRVRKARLNQLRVERASRALDQSQQEQPQAGTQSEPSPVSEATDTEVQPAPPGVASTEPAQAFAAREVAAERIDEEQAAALVQSAKEAPESGQRGVRVLEVTPPEGAALTQESWYDRETRTIVVDSRLDPETRRRQVEAHELLHHGAEVLPGAWPAAKARIEEVAPDLLNTFAEEQAAARKAQGLPAGSPAVMQEEGGAQAAEEVAGILAWARSSRQRFQEFLSALERADRIDQSGSVRRFIRALAEAARSFLRAVSGGRLSRGSLDRQLRDLAAAEAIPTGRGGKATLEAARPAEALRVVDALLPLYDALEALPAREAARAPESAPAAREAQQAPEVAPAPQRPATEQPAAPAAPPAAAAPAAPPVPVPPPVPVLTPAQRKRARQQAGRKLRQAERKLQLAYEAGDPDVVAKFEADVAEARRLRAEAEGLEERVRLEEMREERAQPRVSTRRAEPSRAQSAVEAYEAGEEERFSPAPKHRRIKEGENKGLYVGSPNIRTPAELAQFRKRIRDMALRGVSGRYWYERSGRAILRAVGGDKDRAEQFTRILATFSPQTPVPANMQAALKAWYQFLGGRPIEAGMFGWMNRTAARILAEREPWSGRKTNTFYENLMHIIDPSTRGVTVDIWMMRALGYKTDSPTDQQYEFAEKEIAYVAGKMGWLPHQVQAAVWTSAKADKEGISPEDASFDFSDAIQLHSAQLSFEAIPGRTSGHLPEQFDAPLEQRQEYMDAIRGVLEDEEGRNRVLVGLGLLTPGTVSVAGAYEGRNDPGAQALVALPKMHKALPAKKRGEIPHTGVVDPAARDLMDAAASALGRILKQDAMAWHRPFWDKSGFAKKDKSGFSVEIGRPLTTQEASAVYAALKRLTGSGEFAPIGTDVGFRVLNFPWTGVSNDKLALDLKLAVEETFGPGDVLLERFVFDGNYITNNWTEQPNGEGYRSGSWAGQPDLQQRVDDLVAQLSQEVARVDAAFAERYGWTVAPGAEAGTEPGAAAGPLEAEQRFSPAPPPDSPAFKRWFGDSKVVDEQGKPLVMYRGASAESRVATENRFYTPSWFTSNTEEANAYAGDSADALVSPVYLSIQNPYEANATEIVNASTGMIQRLELEGYDGLIYKFEADEPGRAIGGDRGERVWFVPFRPEQIKSAIGNRGTYDPSSPDIRFSPAPPPDSPAFKRWFGDSKVVDESGRPRVMYHRTAFGDVTRWVEGLQVPARREPFTRFIPGGDRPTTSGPGIWFASTPAGTHTPHARVGTEGEAVFPVYLRLENPRVYTVRPERGNLGFDESGAMWGYRVDDDYVRNELLGRGHDGVMLLEPDGSIVEAVVLFPEQVKSAIGNRGTYDPSSPDIRFSPGAAVQQGPNGMGSFVARDPTAWDQAKRAVLYVFTSVEKVQKDILAAGRKIATAADAVLAEEMYHGRYGQDYRRLKMAEKRVRRLMRAHGISREEIDDFLRALHAPDRNEAMMVRHPNVYDLDNNPGAGRDSQGKPLTRQRAGEIIDRVMKDPRKDAFLKIADEVKQVNRTALDLRVKTGILSPEGRDEWVRQFGEWYVPLRDEETDDLEKAPFSRGKGFSVPKKLSRRAEGRTTTSGSPLVWSFTQALNVANAARRNEVALAFAKLVRDNPNSDLWDVWGPKPSATGDDTSPSVGMLRQMDAVSFHFKEGGHDRYLILKGQTGKALERALTKTGIPPDLLTKVLGPVSRAWSGLATRYNLEFLPRNFFKDLQTAMVRVGVKISAAEAARLPLRSVQAIRAARRVMLAEERNQPIPAGYWEDRFVRWRELGGQIGWVMGSDYATRAKWFDRAGKTGRIKDALEMVGEWFGDLQEPVEFGSRLAAFDAALRSGMGEEQSASFAKNLTVNFNRKGELTGALNSLYWFFNASVQGNRMVALTLASSKGLQWGAGIAALGFITSWLNRWAGDDEDRNRWDETSLWDKTMYANFLFPWGEMDLGPVKVDRVKVPLAWGYSVLWNMGMQLEETLNGHTPWTESFMQWITSFTESFNPMGSTPTIGQFFAPSVVDPFLQVAENTAYHGGLIAPTNFSNVPDSHLVWPDTPEFMVRIAQRLNRMTGGTSRESGAVDVSPEAAKYLTEQITSGPGRLLTRTMDTVRGISNWAMGDGEVQTKDIPFLNSFVSQPNDRVVQGQYRTAIRQIENAAGELKDGSNIKRPQLLPLVEFAKQHKKATKAMRDAGSADRMLASMRSFLAVYRTALSEGTK